MMRLTRMINARGRDSHVRHDVHDRAFVNWQCEHAREHGHECAHGYEYQSHDYVGGCVGADVRVSLSWFLRYNVPYHKTSVPPVCH